MICERCKTDLDTVTEEEDRAALALENRGRESRCDEAIPWKDWHHCDFGGTRRKALEQLRMARAPLVARIAELEAKLAQPAPEKPSAPQEVTTENLDKAGMGLLSRPAALADIRANVERETAAFRLALELMTKERDEWYAKWDKHNDAIGGIVETMVELKVTLDEIPGDSTTEKASALLRRLTRELAEAKAANREQRRKGMLAGFRDAIEYAQAMLSNAHHPGWRDASTMILCWLKNHVEALERTGGGRSDYATGGTLPAGAFGCDVRDLHETTMAPQSVNPAMVIDPSRITTTSKEGKLIIEIVIEKKGES